MTKQELIEKVVDHPRLAARSDQEDRRHAGRRGVRRARRLLRQGQVTRRATPRFTYPGLRHVHQEAQERRAPAAIRRRARPSSFRRDDGDVRARAGAQGVPQPRAARSRRAERVAAVAPARPDDRAHRSAHPRRRRGRAAHPVVDRARLTASSCRSSRTGSSASWSTPIRRRSRRSATTSTSCTSGPRRFSRRRRRSSARSTRVIGKEYRSSRVSMIELRFNPMKRNLGGERDLDYIIAAALRGMDRACLDYGIRAGLIFCLAREFDYELNEIIVQEGREVPRRTASSASISPGPSSTRSSSAATSTAIATCSRARAPPASAPPSTPARPRTPGPRACSR